MTHTLHRSGTRESLLEDWPWLIYQAKGVNAENFPPKARAFIEILQVVGCENWGDVKTGTILDHDVEEISARLSDQSRLRGVFTSREQVVEFLRLAREKDVGISVIISGLIDEVLEACREAGVRPHTLNYSIGVFGNLSKLPSQDVLDITTMCGHHMISPRLVEHLAGLIRRGKLTPEKAALKLGKLCPCGIFNHVRAAHLLAEMAGKDEEATRPA